MLRKLYELHRLWKNYARRKPNLYHIVSLGGIVFWVFLFKSVVLDANNIPTGSMIPTLKIGDFLFVNKMRYTIHFPFTDINLLRIGVPERGDIVTFNPPEEIKYLEGKRLVKRIVGIPGDVLKVVEDEIMVNGVAYTVESATDRTILNDLDYPKSNYSRNSDELREDLKLYKEKIIDPETKKVIKEHYMMKDRTWKDADKRYIIPEGKYFVMGDNRDNSDDSRSWGMLDIEDIHGKVFMVYFSVNWGSRDEMSSEPVNPFFSFYRYITGRAENVAVRWDRVGMRVD
ncbi:MAG: signal peptidase I [Leptospirales bacterium]